MENFRQGLKDSAPVNLAMVPFGLILGSLAQQQGLTPLEVFLLTTVNFAGGSEFNMVSLWANPAPVLLIAVLTFMINSRMLIMGAMLAPLLKDLPLKKVLPSLYLMTDETWALSMRRAQQTGQFTFGYFFGTALPLYIVWFSSALAGAHLGAQLGDLSHYGFALAFPAVFLCLVRGMWRGKKEDLIPWLGSLISAALLYLWQPQSALYVIGGSAVGLALAFWQGGKR